MSDPSGRNTSRPQQTMPNPTPPSLRPDHPAIRPPPARPPQLNASAPPPGRPVVPQPFRPSIGEGPPNGVAVRPVAKRKPVIYLISPVERRASVKLSLVRGSRFTSVFPIVPVGSSGGDHTDEVIEWEVDTGLNGEMRELNTGLTVSYLFWESERVVDTKGHTNDISARDLTQDNSVLLPTAEITQYLDKALKALFLHTEARTSFITFWLPYFLKHPYTALRFLPQAHFSKTAPLEVQPAPDVVTRVFMVFAGVSESMAASRQWAGALGKGREDASWWRQEVGVDIGRAGDEGLFRVLEWGGMEVPALR